MTCVPEDPGACWEWAPGAEAAKCLFLSKYKRRGTISLWFQSFSREGRSTGQLCSLASDYIGSVLCNANCFGALLKKFQMSGKLHN